MTRRYVINVENEDKKHVPWQTTRSYLINVPYLCRTATNDDEKVTLKGDGLITDYVMPGHFEHVVQVWIMYCL